MDMGGREGLPAQAGNDMAAGCGEVRGRFEGDVMCLTPDYFAHPKAEVHDDCKIGDGTRIWQFASVLRGAVIGRDCNIASGACVDGSTLGDRVIVSHNLAMGPGFLVGNDVFIAPNVTFCNDAWPRAHKRGFSVDAYTNGQWAVIVEAGATIGSGAVILPGVRIGHHAMIAANATVQCDVPANTLYVSKDDMRPIRDEEAKLTRRVRFAKTGLQESIDYMAEQGFAIV